MARPIEALPQGMFLLLLRAAVDTAIRHPDEINERRATELARSQPVALRSSHLRHNLGQRRWAWLNEHGVYAQELGVVEPDFIR